MLSFKKGFTLIECIMVIIILSILSTLAVKKYFSLRTETKIATLESIKRNLESGFIKFSTKTYLPSSNVNKCRLPFQKKLQCILINNKQIAFTQKDRHPIFNPFLNSMKQIKVIMDIDVGYSTDGLNYKDNWNLEYDYNQAGISNGFWIFPAMNDHYKDINEFKCKIHYMPENHTMNSYGRSIIILETSDC
ncbi:type II secretion system protein [Aliivibrio sp. S3MY1]|uniref:type II secretion system protein n=1 Tax=unclassified Aliivibrio TaxID=2645654 RepID=UPI002378DEE2|nr:MULTISPECIES: type II secretion system protein [unclassified Aliivibrio]MDD9194977.1 type II secretion system protein [Aliivibrio sp. S3MY1]MDD9198273.1 type II secretion system protein [Aliivibrio sp. S2MY1]